MKMKSAIAVLTLSAILSVPVLAAPNGNIMITADKLAFDGKNSVASATGNVVITKDDKTMTGASGWYNTKNQEAFLTGGVSMIGSNTSMVAQELHSFNNNLINATGGVHLQKDDRQIFGDSVAYNTEQAYGVSQGNARMIVGDSTLTGQHIEGWINKIQGIATGNVTLHNESHKLYATGDRVDYQQTPGQDDGIAYLSGNARAVQNGNVLNGDQFKLEMKDNSVETLGGRSTLVITPK